MHTHHEVALDMITIESRTEGTSVPAIRLACTLCPRAVTWVGRTPLPTLIADAVAHAHEAHAPRCERCGAVRGELHNLDAHPVNRSCCDSGLDVGHEFTCPTMTGDGRDHSVFPATAPPRTPAPCPLPLPGPNPSDSAGPVTAGNDPAGSCPLHTGLDPTHLFAPARLVDRWNRGAQCNAAGDTCHRWRAHAGCYAAGYPRCTDPLCPLQPADGPPHHTCIETTIAGGRRGWFCGPDCPGPCDSGCPDPEAHAEGAHDV